MTQQDLILKSKSFGTSLTVTAGLYRLDDELPKDILLPSFSSPFPERPLQPT